MTVSSGRDSVRALLSTATMRARARPFNPNMKVKNDNDVDMWRERWIEKPRPARGAERVTHDPPQTPKRALWRVFHSLTKFLQIIEKLKSVTGGTDTHVPLYFPLETRSAHFYEHSQIKLDGRHNS